MLTGAPLYGLRIATPGGARRSGALDVMPLQRANLINLAMKVQLFFLLLSRLSLGTR